MGTANNVAKLNTFLPVSFFKKYSSDKQYMLFIPKLPVKAEFTAIVRMLRNAKNAELCS